MLNNCWRGGCCWDSNPYPPGPNRQAHSVMEALRPALALFVSLHLGWLSSYQWLRQDDSCHPLLTCYPHSQVVCFFELFVCEQGSSCWKETVNHSLDSYFPGLSEEGGAGLGNRYNNLFRDPILAIWTSSHMNFPS